MLSIIHMLIMSLGSICVIPRICGKQFRPRAQL